MSVVPPPMSTTMLPTGSETGKPAPTCRDHGLLHEIDLAGTAGAGVDHGPLSTGVISLGTPTTIRGRTHSRRWCACWIKCDSICSVI